MVGKREGRLSGVLSCKGRRPGGRQPGARGGCLPCPVPRWAMMGCTLAWPKTLPVKSRRASGSGFKVGVSGAGRRGRQGGTCRGGSIPHALSLPSAPPNVIGPRGPRSVVGLAPGQLVLECSVEADPAPEIEWHRDGILLQVGCPTGGPRDTSFCPAQAQTLTCPHPGAEARSAPALRTLPCGCSPRHYCAHVMDGDPEARLGFARRVPDALPCSSRYSFERH